MSEPSKAAVEVVNQINSFAADEGTDEEYRMKAARVVDAHIAKARLEEAKWWEHLAVDCDGTDGRPGKDCPYCERIAALEQAVSDGKKEETK